MGLGPGADVARSAGAIQSATSKCATALWRMKEDFHENVTYHGKRCAPCADAVRYCEYRPGMPYAPQPRE